MRLDPKGMSGLSPFMFSERHTVLRDKSEAGDLESFRSAVMGLSSLKGTDATRGYQAMQTSSSASNVALQALRDDKVPRVVSAMERILRGEFSHQMTMVGAPIAASWANPAQHAFPIYESQQLQLLQQQQLYQMQQQQQYSMPPAPQQHQILPYNINPASTNQPYPQQIDSRTNSLS